MQVPENKTFLKITNSEIYSEIKAIRKTLERLDDCVNKINSLAKNNSKRMSGLQKMVIGAYGFSMAILGFFVSYIIKN